MGTEVSQCLGVGELGTRSGRLAQWPSIRRIPILEPTYRPTNLQNQRGRRLERKLKSTDQGLLAIAVLTASLGSSNLHLKL